MAFSLSGSLSTWFLVELEFGNVGFWGEGKTGLSGGKPFGVKERTNNKLNPRMASTPGFQPGPDWWEASALTTAPPMLLLVLLYALRRRGAARLFWGLCLSTLLLLCVDANQVVDDRSQTEGRGNSLGATPLVQYGTVGPMFSGFQRYACKNHHTNYHGYVPWWNLFDIFFMILKQHLVYE